MRSLGYIRRIDDLGRIQIPKEFRERLNIEAGQELELVLLNGLIVVLKDGAYNE